MKKIIVNLLLASLVLSMFAFTGCSKTNDKTDDKADGEVINEEEKVEDEKTDEDSGKEEVKTKAGDNTYGSWFPFGEVLAYEDYKQYYEEPAESLDVDKLCSNVEITPEYLYGDFYFYDGISTEATSDPSEAFNSSSEWIDIEDYIGNVSYTFEGKEITTMPYKFCAGIASYSSKVNGIPGYNWCELSFGLRDPESSSFTINKYTVSAAYEINGDKIIFNILEKYDYDKDTKSIDYQFSGKVIEYSFERKPLSLSFSNGNKTVNMVPESLLDGNNSEFSVKGELEDGQVSNLPFDKFVISCRKSDLSGNCNVEIEGKSPKSAGSLSEEGLITLCVNMDDSITAYQYVVYCCGSDGSILCDEEGPHFFLKKGYLSRDNFGVMSSNNIRPEDMEKLEGLTEETIKDINNTREEFITEIKEVLESIGLEIKLDEETGDVILDASVLFESNSAEISQEGKAQLTIFALAINEILKHDEYKDFVGELNISGHTDSDGDYEYNKELSLKRAEAVRDCLLEALADYPEDQAKIESIISVKGCSYDELIYDEDDNEDKDASRRVVFSFYINLDNYIE